MSDPALQSEHTCNWHPDEEIACPWFRAPMTGSAMSPASGASGLACSACELPVGGGQVHGSSPSASAVALAV